MLLTKITAVQNVVALSHYKVRGIYFTADIFAGTIVKQNFYSLWSQSYTKNAFIHEPEILGNRNINFN